MLQDILTYITVAAAIVYALFQLIRSIQSSKPGCGTGCSSCCSPSDFKASALKKKKVTV
jgi:hypothetical protein